MANTLDVNHPDYLSRDQRKELRRERSSLRKQNKLFGADAERLAKIEELEAKGRRYLNLVRATRLEGINAKAKKIEIQTLDSKAKGSSAPAARARAETFTKKLAAEEAALNTSPNSETLGEENAGFKSLTESTKPKTAMINKPDPAISEMTANVPDVTVTNTPSVKTNVDTLTGQVTSTSTKLNKVISSASPKGIQNTLEDPAISAQYDIRNSDVRDVVNKSQDVKNSPFLQQKMRDIGLTNEEIAEFNTETDKGISKVATAVPAAQQATAKAKEFSTAQFRDLGNPLGSQGANIPDLGGLPNPLTSLQAKVGKNPFKSVASSIGGAVEAFSNGANSFAAGNPFGSLGVDFGNILASVAGAVAGVGSFSELGKIQESVIGGIDPVTKLPAPNIVTETGDTQLAKTVNKGSKVIVEEPTTPVFEVGKTQEAITLADLTYEIVNSKKELELEIKSSSRVIKNLIVNWTLTQESEFATPDQYNPKWTAFQKEQEGQFAEDKNNFWKCHYWINKDGTVQRVQPINQKISPNRQNAKSALLAGGFTGQSKLQNTNFEAVIVTFDAGLLGNEEGSYSRFSQYAFAEYNRLSSKSITAEQWKSFDMIADIMMRHSPGGIYIGEDLLILQSTGEFVGGSEVNGPGFDVDAYLSKKREIEDIAEDPYGDISDDYLNSEVINNKNEEILVETEDGFTNKVYYDEVRGRWTVLYEKDQRRVQYPANGDAIFSAEFSEPLPEDL